MKKPKAQPAPQERQLTQTEASHIARLPWYVGTHAEIAREYGVPEAVIREIRVDRSYRGIRLS